MLKDFWLRILGDILVICFGFVLLYVFLSIEVLGQYGVEQNKPTRWAEIVVGLPIITLGVCLLVSDIKRAIRK